MSGFTRASKQNTKLRCAIFGPSGSGKTFSSLRIASGMGDKIAFIDTERGSASLYADRFTFDVMELEDRSVDGYIAAIEQAKGYEVLVIDSLTHGWQDLLAEVDKLARVKYSGNSWSAWSEGTPKQRKLVDALLAFPGHIIATMRVKTEWTTEQVGGKNRPVRVGLSPEQGKGIEYEFDLLLQMAPDHTATVLKDRIFNCQDKMIEMPGEKFGNELRQWLEDGVVVIQAREGGALDESGKRTIDLALADLIDRESIQPTIQEAWCVMFKVKCLEDLPHDAIQKILKAAEKQATKEGQGHG